MPSKKKKDKKEEQDKSHVCIIHFPQFKQQKVQCLNQKTFDKIKHIADLRKSLSPGSKEKFTDVCNNIPEQFEMNQGYHRQCYSKFTNRVKQLTSGDITTQGTQRTSIRTRQNFISNECVFCEKEGPK